MICEKCGKEITEGASFCISCGAAVKDPLKEKVIQEQKIKKKIDRGKKRLLRRKQMQQKQL